jgi:hypothetical protein
MKTPSSPRDSSHWVAVWTAMPQLTEEDNMPPEPFVSPAIALRDKQK